MCESRRTSWLIITPRFLILVLDVNQIPSSVGRWLDNVILNCLGPTSITSVLSELMSKKSSKLLHLAGKLLSSMAVQFHQVSWICSLFRCVCVCVCVSVLVLRGTGRDSVSAISRILQ